MSIAMHCARDSIHWLYQDIPREICVEPTEHGIIVWRRVRWARGILIQLKTTIRKCYKYVARERFIILIQLVIVSRLCKHVWTLIYFNIHTCIGLDTCHNRTHRNGTCKTVAEQWKLPMEKHHTHTMSPMCETCSTIILNSDLSLNCIFQCVTYKNKLRGYGLW